jgi:hypothetical protein
MKDYCLELVSKNVKAADWKKIEADVRNFLERPSDLDVFSKEALLHLLGP